MFLCVRYSMLDEKEKNCERYLYQKSYICPSSFSSLLCFFVSIILFFLSTRPWDPLNDLIQFEKDGCIQTKVRHRTPMVRSGSLISLSNQGPRRDNCKCQVGCPNRKPLWSNASRRLSHLPSMHLKAPCAPPSLWLLCVVFAVLPPPSSLLLHFIVMFFFLSATTFIFTFLAVRSQCDGRSCQTACCSNWMTRHSSFVHSEETSIVQHEGVHEQYLETLFGCRLFHTLWNFRIVLKSSTESSKILPHEQNITAGAQTGTFTVI